MDRPCFVHVSSMVYTRPMYARNPLLEPTANTAAIQTPTLWPNCCYIQVETMSSFTTCNCVVDADITKTPSSDMQWHAVLTRPVHRYLQLLVSVTAYWTSDHPSGHLGQLLLLFDSQLGAMWALWQQGSALTAPKGITKVTPTEQGRT